MLKEVISLPGKRVSDLIADRFSDYTVIGGLEEMDTDLSHGVQIETADNSGNGHGILVSIYPFIKWTDGGYRPAFFWSGHCVMLEKW